MNEYLKTGKVPRNTRRLLKEKQMDHWTESSQLQFQMISRARNNQQDYSWNLLPDGTLVYYARGEEEPITGLLAKEEAEQLMDQLKQAKFWEMKAYYGIPETKGGDFFLLKAQEGELTKEVIFEAYAPDLIVSLKEFSAQFLENH
ncbi:MAG: hypothetical protein AAF399_23475 [Bacteroidota bacterium]